MKVSIAMASYNGEKYIKKQLDSFLAQVRLPDELIITDDCSTDSTEEIVKTFAESAPFPVIFNRNEKNLGYCGNFNAALMKTTGDLVFLSDQDDVWFPEKIATQARLADENPDMLVLMNDTELTDGELNPVGLTKLGQIKSAGFSPNAYVMGCCCAVRRELLDLCMPIPEGFRAHDKWIVEFAAGLNAKLIDKTVLQYYRRHESNESQFIVNRTVKVSRVGVFNESVKAVFDKNSHAKDEAVISQCEVVIAGLERAIERQSDRNAQLNVMLERKKSFLDAYKVRKKIRNYNWALRIIAVLIFFMKGGYGRFSGIKSMMRDLVG